LKQKQYIHISRRNILKAVGATGLSISPLSGLGNELFSDLTDYSASGLSALIRSRKASCVEVMKAYLSRIHRYNPTYNAVISLVNEDELIKQAFLADQELVKNIYRGWMHGMPHAIKDLAFAKGLKISMGSPIIAGSIASFDELFVSRIRASGAIFIGKTNTPEFGMGSQTYNPVHGVTRNAYNPILTAGGSSGGAAVGLATRMLPCADGSDMMGSLRNPAGYNNVIGFRPSQGRVPAYPVSDNFYQQLSTDGPMGRNVGDAIRLLVTMSGYSAKSPLSLKDELPEYAMFKAIDLEDYKIGWMSSYEGYLPTEKGVLNLCEASLNSLNDHGAIIENCMPQYDMDRLWQTWLTFRHWSSLWAKEYYDDPKTRKLLKPEIIWEVEGAKKVTAYHLREAGIARSSWYQALLSLFEKYDVLALPSAQVFPFAADIHWPDEINGIPMDTYHRWMEVVIGGTLSGLPVVCLPAGFDPLGRPMGIQFIGRMGEDKKLLEFAMSYELVTNHLKRRPVLRDSI